MANTATSDPFGNLPPGVVEEILVRLPIRDAARTSILSRAWRYRWNSMPDLNFSYRLCSSAHGFSRIVNRWLLLRRGPIRKFRVETKLGLGPEIDPWISFLSRHGIEELEFNCCGLSGCRFPSCLFDCKNLTGLELYNCKLDVPPTFEGFVNLKRLHLKMTELDSSNIQRLISRSPLLESLKLMTLFSDLVIIISAPKIKYLVLESRLKDIIYLEDLQELVEMQFCMDQVEMAYRLHKRAFARSDRTLIEVFSGAPNLEKLSVGHNVTKYFKIGYDPGASSTTFNHLKFMELMVLEPEDVDQVLGVQELLLSAPNLEKIVIHFEETAESSPIKLQKVYSEFWLKYLLKRGGFMKLKAIEIDIVCEPAEVEFAKFLLCSSPVLEEMKVKCCGQTKAEAISMFEKLLELPRASAQAAITFYYEEGY